MQRIIIYGIILGVFVLIINLLKYDNNFKGLSYDSTVVDVISYGKLQGKPFKVSELHEKFLEYLR